MTEFKVQPNNVLMDGSELRIPHGLFVAPGPDRTYQRAGEVVLTAEEAADFNARMKQAPAGQQQEFSNDLTAEEYNRLMEYLMEWSAMDSEALFLANMVKNKFGASVRRRG